MLRGKVKGRRAKVLSVDDHGPRRRAKTLPHRAELVEYAPPLDARLLGRLCR